MLLEHNKPSIDDRVRTARQSLRRLIELYLENAKITTAEKLTLFCTAATVGVICLVLGLFALAFITVALIELLALAIPVWASYLIFAGIYGVIILALILLREPLIMNPIARFLSKLLLEPERRHTDDKKHAE
ncbi:MAG: phage holin family protein [[Clostridium] fimetarium]|nr:phage holin family protein [Alistipes timonensis]MCM1405392.1 phage holin family protein [[Clostridium] fimetarium]